jgi:hypothetical protein
MGRTAIFGIVTVLGLLVSKPSLAQFPPSSASAPAAQPVRIEYKPGNPVPPGYHVESEVRSGFLVTGSIFAGLGYTLGAATIGATACPTDRWLWLPFAGPFVALANESRHVTSGPCDDPEGLRHSVRMMSGIGEGVGGLLLLLAAVHRRTYLVADGASLDAHSDSRRTWAIVPALGRSSAGVGVIGSF